VTAGDRNPEEYRVGCSPELSTASRAWCCWSLIRCGSAQSCEAMVEQSSPTRGAGEDAAPEVDASPSADPGRRPGWRPRWLVAKPRRPPWWEVPPQGYLEVESRNSPTSPRALRTLARTAARAGLSWNPGSTLPVQRLVEEQERARLVFQARRELPRVTAVARPRPKRRCSRRPTIVRPRRWSLAVGWTSRQQQQEGPRRANPRWGGTSHPTRIAWRTRLGR
jgi:hypothetical protein